MPLCEGCHYKPWGSTNPVTEEEFLERLATVGVIPSGAGLEDVGVGSPFRYPSPLLIRMCCLDRQLYDLKEVDFSAIRSISEVEVVINLVRLALYEEVGLPAIGNEPG